MVASKGPRSFATWIVRSAVFIRCILRTHFMWREQLVILLRYIYGRNGLLSFCALLFIMKSCRFKIVLCMKRQYTFGNNFLSLESSENNWLKPMQLNALRFHFNFSPKLLRKENLLSGEDDFHWPVLNNKEVNELTVLMI
jgi:hypothetical protein